MSKYWYVPHIERTYCMDIWACTLHQLTACRFSCTDQKRSNARCKTILWVMCFCVVHTVNALQRQCARAFGSRPKEKIIRTQKQFCVVFFLVCWSESRAIEEKKVKVFFWWNFFPDWKRIFFIVTADVFDANQEQKQQKKTQTNELREKLWKKYKCVCRFYFCCVPCVCRIFFELKCVWLNETARDRTKQVHRVIVRYIFFFVKSVRI